MALNQAQVSFIGPLGIMGLCESADLSLRRTDLKSCVASRIERERPLDF